MVAKKLLPKGSRLVTAISISANDKYVVASDAAEKVAAYIFELSGGEDPVADASINAVVTHLMCHPKDDNVFACCGEKHLTISTLDPGAKTVKS